MIHDAIRTDKHAAVSRFCPHFGRRLSVSRTTICTTTVLVLFDESIKLVYSSFIQKTARRRRTPLLLWSYGANRCYSSQHSVQYCESTNTHHLSHEYRTHVHDTPSVWYWCINPAQKKLLAIGHVHDQYAHSILVRAANLCSIYCLWQHSDSKLLYVKGVSLSIERPSTLVSVQHEPAIFRHSSNVLVHGCLSQNTTRHGHAGHQHYQHSNCLECAQWWGTKLTSSSSLSALGLSALVAAGAAGSPRSVDAAGAATAPPPRLM